MKKSHWLVGAFLSAALLAACGANSNALSAPTSTPGSAARYSGTFADGAKYLIEVPAHWSGTLLLWSHGMVDSGLPNPADDGNKSFGEPLHSYLLSHGYALGGSSYCSAGYAAHCALADQIEVLNTFDSLVGQPSRTIAWGESLGGMISARLVQDHPTRFSAALPFCGILSGTVGLLNQWLDSAFALNVLLASDRLQVVNITQLKSDFQIARTALKAAQASPKGRARIDLIAALSDLPGWTDAKYANPPEPGRTDYTKREANNFLSLEYYSLLFFFLVRHDVETAARGNPSWNTGVDYRRQLDHSVDRDEVKALYAQAGLSLNADLNKLNEATRITADPTALKYVQRNITFNGELAAPVLTVHTIGDDIANVQLEDAFAGVVRERHYTKLLREAFVHRAGHVNFTAAERMAALQALIDSLDSGQWKGIDPAHLNRVAYGLGTRYNVLYNNVPAKPAFVNYQPGPFLRPFDDF